MLCLPLLLLFAFQEQPTFRSEVALIHVDAEVRSQGHSLDGLMKEDFRIIDGGKPQEILYFGHQEEPLDVVLLFDTSSSMEPAVASVSTTARAALSELRKGDRAAVMAFDRHTDLILDLTPDFAAVDRAIREQVLKRKFIPSSQIQRGVDDAALHLSLQPAGNRRRAVLVITDNRGSSPENRALRDFWEADTVLSGLIVKAGIQVVFGPQMLGGFGITGIAEKTGGDTLNVNDAGAGFREMIQRLRLRYSLHYAMPQAKLGEERRVRVELSPDAARRYPQAKVRARSGYVVPDANPHLSK